MSSIFKLKTREDELQSSNFGISRKQYQQISATREIQNESFTNGSIKYRFELNGTRWWLPAQSYFRTRYKIYKVTDAVHGTSRQLQMSDGIAPNMNITPTLFRLAEVKINDRIISKCPEYLPQIDTLNNRLHKSDSWFKTVGASTNFWNGNLEDRLMDVSVDGEADIVTKMGRTQLGFDCMAPSHNGFEVDIVVNSKLVTFVVGNNQILPDISLVYKVGDYFWYNGFTPIKITAVNKTGIMVDVGFTTSLKVVDTCKYKFGRINPKQYTSTGARKLESFESIWNPSGCLPIFGIDHALPCGGYEIILNPQTKSTLQTFAIESFINQNPSLDVRTQNGYRVEIEEMYFYCCTYEAERCTDLTYLLDLKQTLLQTQDIESSNFSQKMFDVPPSSYALTVAYQDGRNGIDTRFSCNKFRCYDTAGDISKDQSLDLSRFMLQYAGESKPSPDAQITFNNSTDFTTSLYTNTLMESLAYFDTGGAETIQKFHNLGQYFHYLFPRDATDRSTRVVVYNQFNSTTDVKNMRVLLFSHAYQVARIQIKDSRIYDIQVEDV